MKRIGELPDDILLGIFDFYVDVGPWSETKIRIQAWQSLVHVCQRWRTLVLESPRRLNLQLLCTPETPIKDIMDVWPAALPLIVKGSMSVSRTNNVITALGQNNRVCRVSLWNLAGWQSEEVVAAMQVPFPELTYLRLVSDRGPGTQPVTPVPNSFLGGSAPRLQTILLSGIPFPGVPNLLLCANHLVDLSLSNIPHAGYISPEAMAALISVLSSLRMLWLHFLSPQSHPDWESQSLPPLKRSNLPALKEFHFHGVSEYLEELVNRIDTPQINVMDICFFNQIDFECPRLAQFIHRTPRLRERDTAHIQFNDGCITVGLRFWTPVLDKFLITITFTELDWQHSSIEQICNSSLHPISTVEDLYLEHLCLMLVWENGAVETALWSQFLLPFTAVKKLYISKEFAPDIAAALQDLVEGRITDVLPSLQNIYVEGLETSGPFEENIGRFVAARRLSDHPIAISVWDKNPYMEWT